MQKKKKKFFLRQNSYTVYFYSWVVYAHFSPLSLSLVYTRIIMISTLYYNVKMLMGTRFSVRVKLLVSSRVHHIEQRATVYPKFDIKRDLKIVTYMKITEPLFLSQKKKIKKILNSRGVFFLFFN